MSDSAAPARDDRATQLARYAVVWGVFGVTCVPIAGSLAAIVFVVMAQDAAREAGEPPPARLLFVAQVLAVTGLLLLLSGLVFAALR